MNACINIFQGKTELIAKLLQDIGTEANATDLENEKELGKWQVAEKGARQIRRFKRFIHQCSARFLRRALLAFVITYVPRKTFNKNQIIQVKGKQEN